MCLQKAHRIARIVLVFFCLPLTNWQPYVTTKKCNQMIYFQYKEHHSDFKSNVKQRNSPSIKNKS